MLVKAFFACFQIDGDILHLLPPGDGNIVAMELLHHCRLGEFLPSHARAVDTRDCSGICLPQPIKLIACRRYLRSDPLFLLANVGDYVTNPAAYRAVDLAAPRTTLELSVGPDVYRRRAAVERYRDEPPGAAATRPCWTRISRKPRLGGLSARSGRHTGWRWRGRSACGVEGTRDGAARRPMEDLLQ